MKGNPTGLAWPDRTGHVGSWLASWLAGFNLLGDLLPGAVDGLLPEGDGVASLGGDGEDATGDRPADSVDGAPKVLEELALPALA